MIYTDKYGNTFKNSNEACLYYGLNYSSVRKLKKKDESTKEFLDRILKDKTHETNKHKKYNIKIKEPILNEKNLFYKYVYKNTIDSEDLMLVYKSFLNNYDLKELNKNYIEALDYLDYYKAYLENKEN